VGTAIFASFGESLDPRLRIVFGFGSVLAAKLASLQTFLRFSERSEQHRMAAAKYGIVRREIEHTLAMERTHATKPRPADGPLDEGPAVTPSPAAGRAPSNRGRADPAPGGARGSRRCRSPHLPARPPESAGPQSGVRRR